MLWHTKYIGIPFVDNGHSFQGCDCGGLAWLVYASELGHELPCFDVSYSAFDKPSTGNILRRALNGFFTSSEPGEFRLAVFGRKYLDYHVGIFLDRERILHCKEGEHAKIAYIDELPYYRDFRGAYALA